MTQVRRNVGQMRIAADTAPNWFTTHSPTSPESGAAGASAVGQKGERATRRRGRCPSADHQPRPADGTRPRLCDGRDAGAGLMPGARSAILARPSCWEQQWWDCGGSGATSASRSTTLVAPSRSRVPLPRHSAQARATPGDLDAVAAMRRDGSALMAAPPARPSQRRYDLSTMHRGRAKTAQSPEGQCSKLCSMRGPGVSDGVGQKQAICRQRAISSVG